MPVSDSAAKVVMLRGVNVGPSNRIAMPELREALAQAGFENPRTHVQSGNIVLGTELDESALSDRVESLLAQRFQLHVPAVTRSGQELVRVVAENPLSELADREPKRFQITFVQGQLPADTAERLSGLAAPSERVAVRAREVYAWHPDGIARSKLATQLGAKAGLGKDVVTTSRNWATVRALLEMAVGDGS